MDFYHNQFNNWLWYCFILDRNYRNGSDKKKENKIKIHGLENIFVQRDLCHVFENNPGWYQLKNFKLENILIRCNANNLGKIYTI